jgi:hypothetical protein
MNDDLTRMVLNPDVTVRSRGVIEKCSFCVQRTQESKLNAKKKAGQWLTAISKPLASRLVLPTRSTLVMQMIKQFDHMTRVENPNRQFYVLEQLHVLPNVTYMAKVRNKDEEHEGGHEAAKKEEKHEAAH